MKVFALEDDPDRIRALSNQLADDTFHCVQTCEREYEFKPPYDLILLDYDLGGRWLEEHEDNGLAFVRLIKGRINANAVILIHSYNPDGAAAMLKELGDRGAIVPFGTKAYWETIKYLRDTLINIGVNSDDQSPTS